MCYFIGIEDLVANALIEIVEKTGNRNVLFSQLNRYGDAVLAKLKKDQMDVTLIFTKDSTERFFHDCSDIFSIKELDDDVKITLKDEISTNYLRKRFRINIALNLLHAFVDSDVVKEIIGV